MGQTTVNNKPDKHVAGMEFEGRGGANETLTKVALDSDIPFGYAVARSAADPEGGGILPTANTQEFIGVSRFEYGEDANIPQDTPGGVWADGCISVQCVTGLTIVPGEQAYVIVAAGADRGKFTNVDGGGANLATSAKFTTAVGNDDLAAVRLKLVQ